MAARCGSLFEKTTTGSSRRDIQVFGGRNSKVLVYCPYRSKSLRLLELLGRNERHAEENWIQGRLDIVDTRESWLSISNPSKTLGNRHLKEEEAMSRTTYW